jgi:hypothetical protein
MFTYKLSPDFNGMKNETIIRSDGVQIPPSSDNTDYQAYLKWLEEGNTPLPADEVTE